MKRLAACAALLLAVPLIAQRTWIVDWNGGPGTDFTDLPPAVAAAADGDTLLVRSWAGSYSGVSISKALTVLGDPNTAVGPLVVTRLPAGKAVVVKRFLTTEFHLWANAGRIHLADLQVSWFPGSDIRSCGLVTIHGSSVLGDPGLIIEDSTVVLTETRLQPWGVSAALLVDRSHVVIDGGVYTGAAAICISPNSVPSPAIEGANSALLITGDRTRIEAGAGSPTCLRRPPTPAIRMSASSVIVDSGVGLVPTYGGPPIGGGAAVVVTRVPGIVADGPAPGGVLTTDLYAPAGSLTATFVSTTTLPSPSGLGPLWLDPGTAVLVDAAVMGPGEHRAVAYTIPQGAFPRGLPLVFQAAADASAGLVLSTPGTAILH